MFKKWFWNLLIFAFDIFAFILLSWFVSGMIMGQINSQNQSVEKEIKISGEYSYDKAMVCFSDTCIMADIADTKEKQRQGLMFRRTLSSNEGMLFMYQTEEARSYWMKNMLVPIDIIFLDSSLRVVHITSTIPCDENECVSYEYKSKYVLEVAQGFSKDNNINVGDYVRIELNSKTK